MNNIVSKILIVANLVFSLCFRCFAGAVYSFQAGWHEKATKTATQLPNANGQSADVHIYPTIGLLPNQAGLPKKLSENGSGGVDFAAFDSANF